MSLSAYLDSLEIDAPPHLKAWDEDDDLNIRVTYDDFSQRRLALEQLFLFVHIHYLGHEEADYRAAAYKPFWDLCKSELARWVPIKSHTVGECFLKFVSEGIYADRAGAGCFAVLSLNWGNHEKVIVEAVGQQLSLFGGGL